MDTNRIKKLAKEQSKSLTSICKLIDRPVYYLNDIAKSPNYSIPDDDLRVIAKELGTTISYLKWESDDPNPNSAIPNFPRSDQSKVDVSRIKDLAKSQGKSIAFICNLINRPKYYLNDIAKSTKSMMPNDDLKTIAIDLNTSVEYLRGETDDPNFHLDSVGLTAVPYENRGVRPVVGRASAGLGVIATQEILGYESVDSKFDTDSFFWLLVRGDSMSPVINSDDLVLVEKDVPVESNTVMVVIVDDDDGFVKKVYVDDDTVTLQSYNPNYRPMVFGGSELSRLRFIGRVRELKRRF